MIIYIYTNNHCCNERYDDQFEKYWKSKTYDMTFPRLTWMIFLCLFLCNMNFLNRNILRGYQQDFSCVSVLFLFQAKPILVSWVGSFHRVFMVRSNMFTHWESRNVHVTVEFVALTLSDTFFHGPKIDFKLTLRTLTSSLEFNVIIRHYHNVFSLIFIFFIN